MHLGLAGIVPMCHFCLGRKLVLGFELPRIMDVVDAS